MPARGPEYPCRRYRMSLEGDCKDCLNRDQCLNIPVVPLGVLDEIELVICQAGVASTGWWSEEADDILSALGPPAPGYEGVNKNPWCG